MSLLLTIDRGNSALKLALWRDDAIVAHRQCHQLTTDDIGPMLAEWKLDGVIYSSVVDDTCEGVEAMRRMGIPTVTLTCDTELPITIGYITPHTLGRDRIAAAVGAWSLHPHTHLLVVDIGTAVTYDVVRNDCFEGGNIAPGPWMRLESLHRLTARLPQVDPEGDYRLWGETTATAMRAGSINGIIAEIEYYRGHLGPDSLVVITGGDSYLVTPHLKFRAECEPDLVHIGLKEILTRHLAKLRD